MLNSTNMAFITKSLSQFISSGIPYRQPDPIPSPYILSTSPPDSSMELYVLEHRLQVCFLPKSLITEFCHSLIKISLLSGARPKFFSITETKDGYTLIVTDDDFQKLPHHPSLQRSDQLWRVLTVSVGAMGTNNELGGVSKIAKSVIGPLADHAISVLCMCTYQADFILVKESQLDDAVRCLSSSFKIFNEDHQRLNDSHLLSSSPTSPSIAKKVRPIVHPLSCPDSLYHITGLDASKVPSVVQLLLELLFYSGDKPEDDNYALHFFHFSIVSGDISLVLDSHTMKKFPNNVLYTRKTDDVWKMVMLGENPLGFDECGIVAQVVEPLASSQMSTYYISSYNQEYFMVLEKDFDRVMETLNKLKIENFMTSPDEIISETNSGLSGESNGCMIAVPELMDGIIENNDDENNQGLDEQPCGTPCGIMSLGQALQQKENICPYGGGLGGATSLHLQQHNMIKSKNNILSDDSSCGTSPMSDSVDHVSYGSANNMTKYDENRKCVTDPIPIPP